ncbi:MAG: enoyl-CoA hydratase/isomerase family protein [Aestuariivirga sp.]|nr:enoyl-CoA hydratase/isomerase family protein [Aestuariivirga sp.]
MPGAVLSEIVEESIRMITLNRPGRLNAVNGELLRDLLHVLTESNADPQTRVVILRGAGRAFSSGDDLKDFENQTSSEAGLRSFIEQYQAVSREILYSPKIVIAAVHGWAVGGALEWIINCDFTIFSTETRCFFPEISYGLFVTGAVTTLLTKQIGPQRTKELIILGEKFGADRALALGIAGKTVELTDLEGTALELARKICERPKQSVSDLKRVVNQAYHLDLEQAMTLETDAAVRGFLDPSTADRITKAAV